MLRKTWFRGGYISALVLGSTLMAGVVLAATTGALVPTSDGAYTDFTPSAGSGTHYTQVDDAPCFAEDYNFTTTVGHRDSYGVGWSIPSGSTVTKIEIVPCAAAGDYIVSGSTMNVFYRWDGAQSADAGNYQLSTSNFARLATTTFDNLSLTVSDYTNFEIGAVYSAGDSGVNLGGIKVHLTYN